MLECPLEAVCWLLNCLDDAAYIISRKEESIGRILAANKAAERRTGYSQDELRSMNIVTDLGVEDSVPSLSEVEKILARGDSTSFVLKKRASNGERYWESVVAAPFRYRGEPANISINRDITDQVTYNLGLQKTNEALQAVLDTMGEGLVVMDKGHRLVRINRMGQEMFQYSEEEIVGKHYTFWVHPDFETKLAKQLEQRTRGKPSTYEAKFVRKDGSVFWASINAAPVMDKDGSYQGSVGCLRDITEKRRMKQELEKREQLFADLFEAMAEGVVLIDSDGQILEVNSAGEKILGLDREEIRSRNYVAPNWDIVRPDGTSMLAEEMPSPRAMKERCPITGVEMGVRRPSGTIRWINVSASPLNNTDDELLGVVGIFTDMTARKEAEQKLRSSHEFIKRLLQTANAWIMVVDNQGQVLVWNRKAEELSGYTGSQVKGNNGVWKWLYPDPVYRRHIQEQQREALEASSFVGVETNITTAVGKNKIMSWYGREISGETPEKSVIIGYDITRQRRNEQELQAYASQVEQLSVEKDLFLSTASHQLRTPLTAIQGYADFLAREKELTPEQYSNLGKIQTQSRRLNRLIEDLLDISRIESGNIQLNPIHLNVSTVLDDVLTILEPQLAQKRIATSVCLNSPSQTAFVDPDALEQILVNLLANSITYTPRNGYITVQSHLIDEMIQVEISDSGIGIEDSHLSRVFEPFYRSTRARDVTQDGTGLGLSIVRRLVAESGGEIWAESPGMGEGSTFLLNLPVSSSIAGND